MRERETATEETGRQGEKERLTNCEKKNGYFVGFAFVFLFLLILRSQARALCTVVSAALLIYFCLLNPHRQ